MENQSIEQLKQELDKANLKISLLEKENSIIKENILKLYNSNEYHTITQSFPYKVLRKIYHFMKSCRHLLGKIKRKLLKVKK